MKKSELKLDTASRARSDGIYRRYQRRKLKNYSGDIADDKLIVGGIVEDVSANGFKLSGVSSVFDAQKYNYQVIVSGGGKYFKLMARPCWQKKGTGTKDIGFKVMDASCEWYEFVLESFEQESGEPQMT
jgi:hypothetical protein